MISHPLSPHLAERSATRDVEARVDDGNQALDGSGVGGRNRLGEILQFDEREHCETRRDNVSRADATTVRPRLLDALNSENFEKEGA